MQEDAEVCAGAAHHAQAVDTSRPEHGAAYADIKSVQTALRLASELLSWQACCTGVQGCAGNQVAAKCCCRAT